MSSSVLLGSVKVSIKSLRLYPTSHARELQHARSAPGYGICQCGYDARLVIRKNYRDLFYLAAWPSRNGEPIYKHSPTCFFFRDSVSKAVNEAHKSESIKKSSDGTARITPSFSLSRNITPFKRDEIQLPILDTPRKTGPTIRKASALSILYFLFTKSGLNKHNPAQPNDSESALNELYQASYDVFIGSDELVDICRIMRPSRDRVTFAGEELTNEVLMKWHIAQLRKKKTKKRIRSAMFLGELDFIRPTPYGYAIKFRYVDKSMYCSDAVFDQLVKQFGRELKTLNNPEIARQSHIVMLVQFEATDTNNAMVINAACMVVSKNYIPVDSSHELRLANLLADNQRAFEKPLTIQDGLLPDFILRDCEPPVFMEVWGMNSDEYVSRKQEKILSYSENQMQLWEWDALSERNIPSLPKQNLEEIEFQKQANE